MSKKLHIIHEDDYIIVLAKPSGILTIPDRHNKSIPNISGSLKKTRESVYTIHRIDKETSGLLIFAKTEDAHRKLSIDFQERNIQKKYLAFVKGILYPTSGSIDFPIRKSATSSLMKVADNGKPSLTHYEVIESYKSHSLVSIELMTGRTHQIRVHMAFIHHPLMIDELYGKSTAFYVSEIKGRKYKKSIDTEERPLLSRLTLHAYSIKFNHPNTGEEMYFEAPFPKDLRALQNQLSKI